MIWMIRDTDRRTQRVILRDYPDGLAALGSCPPAPGFFEGRATGRYA